MENGDTAEDKSHTFRKRRLSLTNLRQHFEDDQSSHDPSAQQNPTLDTNGDLPHSNNNANHNSNEHHTITEDEKAHSFRKRRLSLTHSREDSSHEEQEPARRRRASDASMSSLDSNSKGNRLKSRIVHASELLAHPPPSPSIQSELPKLYQQSAPPQKQALLDTIGTGAEAPKWKKRHTRHAHEDERTLPFPRDIVGTFSCHGVEPIYDSDYEDDDNDNDNGEWAVNQEKSDKPTTAAKINQDRGGVAFPYGNCPRTALFAVYDGKKGWLQFKFVTHMPFSLVSRNEWFTFAFFQVMAKVGS